MGTKISLKNYTTHFQQKLFPLISSGGSSPKNKNPTFLFRENHSYSEKVLLKKE